MNDIIIRTMTIDDYDRVAALWAGIKGFGIRSIDDSREGIERFLRRNPNTSVVAEMDGKLVGSILCGHDGRQGCLYHVCVDASYRQHGIGRKLVAKSHLQETRAVMPFGKRSAGSVRMIGIIMI